MVVLVMVGSHHYCRHSRIKRADENLLLKAHWSFLSLTSCQSEKRQRTEDEDGREHVGPLGTGRRAASS
jgi:hypothetical protein